MSAHLDHLSESIQPKHRSLGHVVAAFVEALVRDGSPREELERLRAFGFEALGHREAVDVDALAALFRSDHAVKHLLTSKERGREEGRGGGELHCFLPCVAG